MTENTIYNELESQKDELLNLVKMAEKLEKMLEYTTRRIEQTQSNISILEKLFQ